MTPEDISRYIAAGESQTVEFKRRLPPPHIVGRVLAGFANAHGGVLIVGVSDDRDVTGLTDIEARTGLHHLRDLANSLLPQPTEVGVVSLHGRRLLYAIVEPAPDYLRPVLTSRGEAVVRENDALVSLPQPAAAPRPAPVPVRVFVAMSFREEQEPALVDYWQAIRRAAKRAERNIDLQRIDLKEGDYEISQEIMREIDAAAIVIADFTLNSRNVYFELGYARGKGKRLIQTARKDTQLEFDVRNWRTLFYRNATELEQLLVSALVTACD